MSGFETGGTDAEERVFADHGAVRPGPEPVGFARRAFADQLSIETPEQVALTFPVAGIGSRFVALLLDGLIQMGTVIVGFFLFLLVQAAAGPQRVPSLGNKWFVALLIFAAFLLFWGYFTLFEALWHGQTPGKRAMKLRVIKDSGRQITLFESLARNLLRVADYLPSLYLIGVITMLANKKNKRLGDLAAGTVVVHEREQTQGLLLGETAAPAWSPGAFASAPAQTDGHPRPHPEAGAGPFPADALQRLSSQDLVVIEAFFARALDLSLELRAAMAARILEQLCGRAGLAVPAGNPERRLEELGLALRRLPRRR